MKCAIEQEFDHRVKTETGMAVHAAREVNRGYDTIKKDLITACGLNEYYTTTLATVKNNETITCKNCLKVITIVDGDIAEEAVETTYVVREKESGYFRSNKSGKSWTSDIAEAILYKTRAGAISANEVTIYRDDCGNIITSEEYWNTGLRSNLATGRLAKNYTYSMSFDYEKYEILEVEQTITLKEKTSEEFSI